MEDLDSIRLRNNVTAMGLVIVRDDRVALLETRGINDRKTGAALSDTAIFRIGSISKMFTGLAAAELEAQGRLDLERPISHFNLQGTYRNPWQASHPISTAQLLEHSAGLTDMIKAEWDYSDPRQLPLRETLRLYPQARTVRWPPGLHHSYSNASTGLAGRVLEQAAGQAYEILMRDLVFGPLGLRDTSVLPPPMERLPTGYDTDGNTPIPYWHQIFRPFAAINASLQDMAVFLRVLIARGKVGDRQVFSEATITRVETPTTTLAARAGLNFGYGLGNYGWLRDGTLFKGHGGDADGYLSRLGYTRANRSGYYLVITAFQHRTLGAMQARVEEHLLRGLEMPKSPPAFPLGDGLTESLIGEYSPATWRWPGTGGNVPGTRVFQRQGKLYSRRGTGEPRRLIPVSERLFRRPSDNRATLFIGGDNGEIYFQEDGENFRKMRRRAQP